MSVIDALEPIYSRLPVIKAPPVKPSLKTRLFYTGIVLLMFLLLSRIPVFGIAASKQEYFKELSMILASRIGSVLTVGIGPIVVASIVLQILIGSKLIELDLSNPKERAKFMGMQKLLAILFAFVEAYGYVSAGLLTPADPSLTLIVVLQIAFGAILLIYLDEIVTYWGIGSGISLFIASGVAATIFWRIFNPFPVQETGIPHGAIFQFIYNFPTDPVIATVSYFLPILFVFIIFFLVIYAEGIFVNIPLSVGVRGYSGRFPLKLLYVSNIPVIFAVSLFMQLQILGTGMENSGNPLLSSIGSFIVNLFNSPYMLLEKILISFYSSGLNGLFLMLPEILFGLSYMLLLIITSVAFGLLWIDVAGQGPDAVAEQIIKGGMHIPGFRRDPRVIRAVLARYIIPIVIVGSAFVGFLAGVSSFVGVIGSGIGLLLATDILYRLYEQLEREGLFETFPSLKKILGSK